MRILLCEDTDLNREIMLLLMKRLGHQARVASTGAEAVEEAAAGGYDLVFMDLNLPDMDGFEAVGLIRALPDPKAAAVPVIGVTADAVTPELRRKAAANGMAHCLGRPLKMDDLARIMDDPGHEIAADPLSPVRSGPGLIRWQVSLDLMGGHEDSLLSYCDTARSVLPGKISRLRELAEQANLAELARLSHALKSMAYGFGADLLAEKLVRAEKMASERRMETLDLMPEVAGLLEKLVEEINVRLETEERKGT